MRNYTEIISRSKRRRHLTISEPKKHYATGPALCSRNTYGATVDNAGDRIHAMDFNAVPLCKTCARIAEGLAEYDAKTALRRLSMEIVRANLINQERER